MSTAMMVYSSTRRKLKPNTSINGNGLCTSKYEMLAYGILPGVVHRPNTDSSESDEEGENNFQLVRTL